MITIETNAETNRIHLTMSGHLDGQAIDEGGARLLAEVGRLRRGFDIITDIRQFHPTGGDGLEALHRVMTALLKGGLGRVVRVSQIPITALQWDRVSDQVGYRSITVFTREEAERVLASDARASQAAGELAWERLRKTRRVAVGPDHTIRFRLGKRNFPSIPMINLSAGGCFCMVEKRWASSIYERAILMDFCLEHEDLPTQVISAKVVRVVQDLGAARGDAIGLGIQFLCDSPSFMEWINAYVSAYSTPD